MSATYIHPIILHPPALEPDRATVPQALQDGESNMTNAPSQDAEVIS